MVDAVFAAIKDTFDATAIMDVSDRMIKVASASTTVLVDHIASPSSLVEASTLSLIPSFREQVATRATALMRELRSAYLSGARGAAPASPHLNKTKPVYEFVRLTLGIPMHGKENESYFANGLGVEQDSIGQNISLIHEVSYLRQQ
jgi:phenylalanine ammonia-lyase